MGSKRSHDDLDSIDGDQEHAAASFPAKKRKFNANQKHKAKEGSLEWAKKRVRAIERLIQRDQGLPANVRNDLERELAAHKATITDKSFQKRRSEMISKYHMVRFFERKKAMRLAKQLRRKIEATSDPDETTRLRNELHVAEVDEAYALNFPHLENYISLYGGSKKDEQKDSETTPSTAKVCLAADRPPMWTEVEKAMEEGPDALKRLRERRPAEEPRQARKVPKPTKEQAQRTEPRPETAFVHPSRLTQNVPAFAGQKPKPDQPKLNRRQRRKLMHEKNPPARQVTNDAEEEDDDGGGFFEEDV